jgi:hypothetical protein
MWVRVNEHICFPPNANNFMPVSASYVRGKGAKLGGGKGTKLSEGERY